MSIPDYQSLMLPVLEVAAKAETSVPLAEAEITTKRDGLTIPTVLSATAEVYPALWSHAFAKQGRTSDQHDAFSIAAWLSHADADRRLADFLRPNLDPGEHTVAQVEGWILGV